MRLATQSKFLCDGRFRDSAKFFQGIKVGCLDDFAVLYSRLQDFLTENRAKDAKKQVKEREENMFAMLDAHVYVPSGASKLTVDVLKHAIRDMQNDYREQQGILRLASLCFL